MQTYRKPGRGLRPMKLQQEKIALNQLKNMSNIVVDMGRLAEYLDNYPEVITSETIKSIAEAFVKRESLLLTEEHIDMVLKKYE